MEKKLYKSFELKATGDNGEVEGYASTWTKDPDSYGDIVIRGAFKETLEKRVKTGHPFPLCYGHDLNQIIGKVDEIAEDDTGLKLKASFLNSDLAQEKRELVKEGIVWQFSFAYEVLGSEKPTEEEFKTGIRNKLTKLDIYEISLVPIPANQTAVVTGIKGDTPTETKSGKRNSSKDADAIRQAITLLQGVLGEIEEDDDNGKDDPKDNPKGEDSKGSNPEKDRILSFINNLNNKKEN